MLRHYFRDLRLLSFSAWLCIIPIAGSLLIACALNGLAEGREIIAIFSRQNQAGAILFTLAAGLYAVACTTYATLLAAFSRRIRHESSYLIAVWVFLIIITAVAPIIAKNQLSLPGLLWFYVITYLLMPIAGDWFGQPIDRVVNIVRTARPWMVAAVLLAIGVGFFIAVVASPVVVPRWVGALGVLCIAVGFWSLLGTLGLVVLPRKLRLPSLTLVAVAWIVFCERTNDDHLVRLCQVFSPGAKVTCVGISPPISSEPPKRETLLEHENAWLKRACPRRSDTARCPMIFVAAEGGGLRAAYWTAEVLDSVNDATNGAFYRHVFAISSVSGGSLGSVAFIGANAGDVDPIHYESQTTAVNGLLSQDYLTPIIAALVFPETLQRFWPRPIHQFDRATAFEDAIEASWRDQRFRPDDDRMANDFRSLWPRDEQDAMPALIMNSTNVETGARFLISSIELPIDDAYDAYDDDSLYSTIVKLPLSSAIHLSGRFSYVSPAGVINGEPSRDAQTRWDTHGPVPWGRLVDGGYFEGTGSATLSQIVSKMHASFPKDVDPYILVILNNPRPDVLSPPTGDTPILPSRPVEPPSQYWSGIPDIKNKLQDVTTPGSEYTSPIQAWFEAPGARGLGDRESLDNNRGIHMYACLETVPGYQALLKYGSSMAGAPEAIACGGYWEISYAMIETSPRCPQKVQAAARTSESNDYEQPALGWVLSRDSQTSMNDASAAIDCAINAQGAPVKTLAAALKSSDQLNALPIQRTR